MRTTEDMLNLVPNTLREAASALGMPRSLVIRQVAYRAVRTGIVTGILLAVARMTGETAPLIFTALGNSLFSADPTGPMSSLPLDHLRIRPQPLSRTAEARLDRRADRHVGRAESQHLRARPLFVPQREQIKSIEGRATHE